jgi:hypothetical protein
MATVKIQLKYDDNKTQLAQAASAKVEGGLLILQDQGGNEVGRFNMGRVDNWWIEPEGS